VPQLKAFECWQGLVFSTCHFTLWLTIWHIPSYDYSRNILNILDYEDKLYWAPFCFHHVRDLIRRHGRSSLQGTANSTPLAKDFGIYTIIHDLKWNITLMTRYLHNSVTRQEVQLQSNTIINITITYYILLRQAKCQEEGSGPNDPAARACNVNPVSNLRMFISQHL